MMFLLLLPAICFVACGGDDDDEKDKDEPTNTSSILGRYYDVDYPTDYIELRAGGVAIRYIDDEGKAENETGSYVYNAPNITIQFEDDMVYGTISGNTLTCSDGMFVKR